ncbi:MAG: glycosyltransferase family 4 protein [Candidatus Symbiothrix sp.]|jgi:glycosyltransferase involved in cell wall biosynthesis|nr:glycosyltransferase family 4 protein [Candidatus Symbiothrix sp.]
MKIAYVTTWDATDIREWSGTVYHIAEALKMQNADLQYLDKLPVRPTLFSNLRKKFYSRVFGKQIHLEVESSVLKYNAKRILSQLQPDTDVIFSPSSLQIAYINSDKFKVFYTDAVFASLVNRMPWMSNLAAFQIKEWDELEKRALQTSDLALYASDWAAQNAIQYYQVDPDKVKVVPFGANIPRPYSEEEIKKVIDSRPQDICRLIFVGVEWERKGGDFAIKVVQRLHEKKIPVHLDIVGIREELPPLPSYITNHGFISKSTPEGIQRLHELMSNAHFFLLPTRFDAYGIVFTEASAYGLPSLAPKTGGVTTVVLDNRNGMTFDLSADPEEYADYIAHLFSNRESYRRLALSSYNEYSTRLNWNTAGETIMNSIKERI